MLDSKTRKMIEGNNFVSLATLNSDGSPHVTTVWADVRDDQIWINTARGRVKEKNVSKDTRVALSVYEQDNPYNSASFSGKVVEITEEGADEHIDYLAKKYTGAEKYSWKAPGEVRVILKIKPVKI